MFTGRMLVGSVLSTLVFGSAALLGQEKAAAPAPASAAAAAREFPVIMEQNVTAGKSPVGTKIKAKLTAATLANGIVIPRNAVFSGEVTESVAKSATNPSRLAIRMDSVEWKNGSAPIKVYLTGWYYPIRMEEGQKLAYGPPDTSARRWNGAGPYPDPNNPAAQPFPGHDPDPGTNSGPGAPAAVTSDHRVMMKNVESSRNQDGSIVISCARSNIKLDKLTAYVLSSGELVPAK
jgi:hypothetical protein